MVIIIRMYDVDKFKFRVRVSLYLLVALLHIILFVEGFIYGSLVCKSFCNEGLLRRNNEAISCTVLN